MKVDLTTSRLQPSDRAETSRAERHAAAKNKPSDPAGDTRATDRAHFSFDHARVQALTAQALSAPEIRQAKVAALAQAIGDGQYTVDATRVADAVVADYTSGQAS